MSEVHTLTLTRYTQKYLRGTVPGNPRNHTNVIEENQKAIVEACNNQSWIVKGWGIHENPIGHGSDSYQSGFTWSQFDVNHDEETTDEKGLPLGTSVRHRFEMYLRINFEGKENTDSQQFARMCQVVYTKAKQHVLGDWYLTAVDGQPFKPSDDPTLTVGGGDDTMEYAPFDFPEDWETPFEHLFGLESQIKMIKSRLWAAVDSEWEHRFNCALIGPPGCGKTDIASTIAKMLGPDAVLEFDATALTGAGAIQELATREILPRVIVIEEIEKCDQKALNWLLAALDIRGEIRKVTARANIQRDTKVFAICTVNNKKLFNSLCAGALASRFGKPIHFKRLGRDVLEKILKREVEKVNGDEAWVEPTLVYCEQNGIDAPRDAIAICLAGRDALLSGEYQQMLADTSEEPTAEVFSADTLEEEEVVSWGFGSQGRPSDDGD